MGSKHYTVAGGIKLFFEDGLTNVNGFRDMGNLVSTGIESAIEKLEHFTSRTGQRAKDGEAITESGITINFSWDEPNEYNLKAAFLGGAISAVSSGPQQIKREVVQLNGTTPAPLAFDVASTPNAVVTNIGAGTTYTVTTDYTVNATDNTITRVGAGTITDGQWVLVTYDATLPAHSSLPVLTSPIITGRGRFMIFPTTGQRLLWEFPLATIAPDGEFNIDQEDWMSAAMTINILADTASNPAAPFGTLRTWNIAA
jgi:hypothetical protein